jgi:hypothetical protein
LLTHEQELWIRFLAFGMWRCIALWVGDTNFVKENVSAIFSEEVGRCDRERERERERERQREQNCITIIWSLNNHMTCHPAYLSWLHSHHNHVDPKGVANMCLRNAGSYLHDNTWCQCRRSQHQYSMSWKPEILYSVNLIL